MTSSSPRRPASRAADSLRLPRAGAWRSDRGEPECVGAGARRRVVLDDEEGALAQDVLEADDGTRARHRHERPVCSGAESFLAGTASRRIETEDVDGLYAELTATAVLHPVSPDGVTETDFITREYRPSTPTATSSGSSVGVERLARLRRVRDR